MRFVFVTDELPVPGQAGHLALNHEIIRWLQNAGHGVVVLLVGARLPGPCTRYTLAQVAGPRVKSLGPYVLPASPKTALRLAARAGLNALPARLAERLRSARHGADAILGRHASPRDNAWCAGYIKKNPPDAVLIDTIFRAGLLAAPELTGMNSVLVAHDVFHRRHQALRSAGYRIVPAELTQAEETAWLAQASHIVAIQPEEARLITAMCPGRDVFTAPMPALPCPPPAASARIPGRLVFIGSASLPNLDGLRWFFNEVWPHLAGHGVSLDLVGDCAAALRQLPRGVSPLGRVANLAPVLHRAALAIAPLRVGSGLKIKLLDYARHGLFTVATPASLEGFAADAQAPFLRAADAQDFAAGILAACASQAPPEPALAYAQRHYGVETSFHELARALQIPDTKNSKTICI